MLFFPQIHICCICGLILLNQCAPTARVIFQYSI
uniref:Uncharacterized protein n=1 Tax=Anguilla anguilla TaxID=7936 RepID=A0A0E9Q982_ANGAN